MRPTHIALPARIHRALAACVVGSLFALPGLAAAQAPAGTMKQDSATSGKSDVASEGFASAVADKNKDDATEVKIQAGALGASGNSRSLALTSMLSMRARRAENELSAAAAANYGRASVGPNAPVQTTMENYQGKLRYDRFVSDRFALFTSLSGRKDRFQGLDLRLNLDPGVAYYFIQDPKHQLWGEAGYDLQFDIRRDAALQAAADAGQLLDKTDVRHSARLFAGYSNNLNDNVTFNTGLEYLQGLQDTQYWRLNWDAGLTAAIATHFAVAGTFSLRYDNSPLPGVQTTDTLTAVNLVYTLL